jgi:hypothetical protein
MHQKLMRTLSNEHTGQELNAFAEHTHQEMMRTLSIRISFLRVCSA